MEKWAQMLFIFPSVNKYFFNILTGFVCKFVASRDNGSNIRANTNMLK